MVLRLRMGRLFSEDLDFNPFLIPSNHVILDLHFTSSLKKLNLSLNFKDCYYYFHMFFHVYELMLSSCGAGKDSRLSLGQQGDQTNRSWKKSTLNTHWKDWSWSQSSNTLATWCKELTHWRRPWCWEGLKAREGDDRGWDGAMASPTQWMCVWAISRRWWRTEKSGML